MKAYSHSLRLSTATMLAMLLGSYVFAGEANADDIRDISRINRGITIESADRVGDVSSINGGIRINDGASAFEVSTVNGGITIGDGAQVSEAETVNGRIRVGSDVQVQGSLDTVNGSIQTENGTEVSRNIETVNGSIKIRNTLVGKDIETSNGNIDILEGSVVEGDVIIRGKRRWWDRFFDFSRSEPEITIDSDSSVLGTIHLYQEADLNIADEAFVGDIVEHF